MPRVSVRSEASGGPLNERSLDRLEATFPSSQDDDSSESGSDYKPVKRGKRGSIPDSRRRFKCTICEKAFTTSGHLSRHSRIHTGERKFCCPFPGCVTRCSRGDNLQQHYRVHLGPGSRTSRSRKTGLGKTPRPKSTSPPLPDSPDRLSPPPVDCPPALVPTHLYVSDGQTPESPVSPQSISEPNSPLSPQSPYASGPKGHVPSFPPQRTELSPAPLHIGTVPYEKQAVDLGYAYVHSSPSQYEGSTPISPAVDSISSSYSSYSSSHPSPPASTSYSSHSSDGHGENDNEPPSSPVFSQAGSTHSSFTPPATYGYSIDNSTHHHYRYPHAHSSFQYTAPVGPRATHPQIGEYFTDVPAAQHYLQQQYPPHQSPMYSLHQPYNGSVYPNNTTTYSGHPQQSAVYPNASYYSSDPANGHGSLVDGSRAYERRIVGLV